MKRDVAIVQETEQQPVSRKRRGMIAGAAALMVAALAKQGAEPAAAANGNPVILGGDAGGSGAPQSSSGITWIAANPSPSNGPAFRASNAFGATPDATKDGSQGFTAGANNAGLFGRNNDLNGVGTWGEAPSGTGAFGDSTTGSGVAGNSSSGAGVYGQSTSGYGGQFISSSNIGIYGVSSSSYGILGTTTAGGGFSGITGSITTASGAAFAGGASQSTAYAAYFTGKVNIDGPFFVNGSQRFTLKHSDGTSRLVSGALTVEPVVEDFGTGTLTNGAATVTLDADFREVADTGNYSVFLTPGDGAGALRFARRTATGFAVEEIGGASSGTFAWRVAAKPKDGDGGKVARLAKYEQPQIKIPGINDSTPLAGKPTIPTPRPAQGGSGAPAAKVDPPPPQVAPAPRDTAPAAPPAVQPAAPATTGTTGSTGSTGSTGTTAPNPVPPSR